MRIIKAVFFDLDGTLIDSKRDITESVNEIRHDLDLPPLTEAEVICHVGRGTTTLLKEVLPPEVNIESIYPAFIEYYKKNSLKYSDFYEGVPDLLDSLKNYKKALITNKAYAVTMEIVKKYKLEKTFDLVYGGDSFTARKPEPYPLNTAAAELALKKSEILYFGDSLPDYRASEAAEISCVLATYGYGSREDLDSCQNAVFITQPLGLLEIIEKLKNQPWESLI